MDQDPIPQPLPNREVTPLPPEVIFIDENHPSNPFTLSPQELEQRLIYLKLKRGIEMSSPIGDPAFHHNDERLQLAGIRMAQVFALRERGDVLDVGTGSNFTVGRGIQIATEKTVNYLDVVFRDEHDQRTNPGVERATPEGPHLEKYAGRLQDIDRLDSALKNARFGSIVFNGSWVAGGYNNTILDMLDGGYYDRDNPPPANETIEQYRERAVREMISSARSHLTDNGVLIMTSSRFARHGAGYNYEGLPEEKLMFLDVVRHAQELGAKTVQVVGVSSDGLRRVVATIDANPQVQRQLEIGASLERWLDPLGQLRYSIEGEDGHVYSATELRDLITNNDAFRRQLDELSDTPINPIAEQQRITDQLTGGVQTLSVARSHTLSPTSIQRTKQATSAYFSDNIAVIDAISIRF